MPKQRSRLLKTLKVSQAEPSSGLKNLTVKRFKGISSEIWPGASAEFWEEDAAKAHSSELECSASPEILLIPKRERPVLTSFEYDNPYKVWHILGIYPHLSQVYPSSSDVALPTFAIRSANLG